MSDRCFDTVQINISDRCNLFCRHCRPSGTPHRGNTDMTLNLFEYIIKGLIKHSCKRLMLCWIGEPLVNPEFPLMLEMAMKNSSGWETLAMNTNATLLKPELSRKIISLSQNCEGHLHIVLSVDSSSREQFKFIKGIDGFDLVSENIRQLLKLKAELDVVDKVSIVIQSIVTPDNWNTVGRFAQYWSEIVGNAGMTAEIALHGQATSGCCIHFSKAVLPDQPEAERLYNCAVNDLKTLGYVLDSPEAPALHEDLEMPENSEPLKPHTEENGVTDISEVMKKRYLEEYHKEWSYNRPPCSAPWRTPVIAQDGRVTACCRDQGLEMTLGVIDEQKDFSLADVWSSDKADFIRKAHIEGRFEKTPLCHECTGLEPLDLNYAISEANRLDDSELRVHFDKRLKQAGCPDENQIVERLIEAVSCGLGGTRAVKQLGCRARRAGIREFADKVFSEVINMDVPDDFKEAAKEELRR